MRHQLPLTATATATETQHDTLEQVTRSVIQCVNRLLTKRCLDESALDDFQAAVSMLEALPLATDQFGLACSRLNNARHYLRYTEPGAARYELRLVVGSLSNGYAKTREPKRRYRRQG